MHLQREKCPNTEFVLVRIFSYSVRIRANTDQKKLGIWTLHAVASTRLKFHLSTKLLIQSSPHETANVQFVFYHKTFAMPQKKLRKTCTAPESIRKSLVLKYFQGVKKVFIMF